MALTVLLLVPLATAVPALRSVVAEGRRADASAVFWDDFLGWSIGPVRAQSIFGRLSIFGSLAVIGLGITSSQKKGKWQFEKYDAIAKFAAEHDFTLLPILDYTVRWAATKQDYEFTSRGKRYKVLASVKGDNIPVIDLEDRACFTFM